MYGDITFRAAEQLRKPEVLDFFASLIQRVSPKSYKQAEAEVTITRQFLDNFGGDQVCCLLLDPVNEHQILCCEALCPALAWSSSPNRVP